MKVALLSPSLPGRAGANGIVTYVDNMRSAFREIGCDITVFTASEYLTANGARHEIAPLRPFRRRYESFRARFLNVDVGDGGLGAASIRHAAKTIVDAGLADVIEMEESFGWCSAVTGLGVPVVARLHGPHFLGKEPVESLEQRRSSDKRCVAEGRALNFVDGVTSPSQRLLDATIDRYAFNVPSKAIYNPLRPMPDCWSQQDSDPDQVLCVGRFDLRKGADLLLNAFGEVLIARPTARLVMVGPDNGLRLSNGRLVQFNDYMKRIADRIDVNRISQLGTLSARKINQLRRQSALAVVASRFETFSYVLAESMGFGMPVITTDLFGTGEIVSSGNTGLVVPSNNSPALANAILTMLNNKRFASTLASEARAWTRVHLAPTTIAESTVEFYRKLL